MALGPGESRCKTLLDHVERHVAGQRPAGRSHGDVTRSRSRRNRSFYERVRHNREVRRSSIERNPGRSGESLAKNAPGLSDFARVMHEGHEWAEPHVQAENRATAKRARTAGPTSEGCSVKSPTGGLNQPRVGIGAVGAVKVVQRRQRAAWGDCEDGAKVGVQPVVGRGSVEIPIGSLDQRAYGRVS